MCSIKKLFLKIFQYSQKKSVLESLFNKVDNGFIKEILQHCRFPVNIATFLRILYLKNNCGRPLLQLENIG